VVTNATDFVPPAWSCGVNSEQQQHVTSLNMITVTLIFITIIPITVIPITIILTTTLIHRTIMHFHKSNTAFVVQKYVLENIVLYREVAVTPIGLIYILRLIMSFVMIMLSWRCVMLELLDQILSTTVRYCCLTTVL
jgi:magnesium-transporting ATPase (P-type)